ncbi:MAG: hypothetical protein N3F03_05255 [Ignavibacteria bacterium]|nr:hypothetical protein [Ignavibacteria bacterium]
MKYYVFFLFVLVNFLFAQTPEFIIKEQDNIQTRKIILLNKNWIYEIEGKTKNVNVPFWIDEKRVVLKNRVKLNLSKSEIYFLRFEGIRGLSEVYFNDERLQFDPMEIEEYSFRIPANLVRDKGDNFLKIVLTKNFRISEQNVLASKLELPERKSGIYKDVYLEILPDFSFTKLLLTPRIENDLSTGKINFEYEISSHKQINPDSAKNIFVKLEVLDSKNSNLVSSLNEEVEFKGSLITKSGSLTLKNPTLWDLSNPFFYLVRFQIFQDGQLVDQFTSQVAFKKLEINNGKIILNGKPIVLKGVTYFESNGIKNSFFSLNDYERDINLLNDLSVNAIFVKNSFPSNELIKQCERKGILVFVDLDSKIYPSKKSQKFLSDKKRKLNYVLDKYSNYGSFAGINLGLYNQSTTKDYYVTLVEQIKNKNSNILTFVETNRLELIKFDIVDFVAYNFLHKSVSEIETFLSEFQDNQFILISAFGYNHGLEEEAGYSNPYSQQAQAKFISDVLKILIDKKISFFVHTFSDYRLPYHSILAGKLENTLMKYGLVNEYRDKKKLSYQTLKSYLTDNKLPMIMQGEYTEKANVIYVISGLIFLALTIITINSTHRFRENVSRAVLKTYNFFSDIRDGWFISSFHSVVLALSIALSTALTYSGLFHYWKDKLELEQFVSLFNSNILFEFLSYVSWRPIESIIYFTLILIFWMILLMLLVKFFNVFVKNKIFMNHAFLIVVWSAIPFLILIPLGMVIFKVLSLEKYNWLIYSIVILFHIWVITRTLKGISIVFETKKFKVYLVSILLLIVVLASLIMYLQINFSSIDYFMEYFG